jgi:hypothetical protein
MFLVDAQRLRSLFFVAADILSRLVCMTAALVVDDKIFSSSLACLMVLMIFFRLMDVTVFSSSRAWRIVLVTFLVAMSAGWYTELPQDQIQYHPSHSSTVERSIVTSLAQSSSGPALAPYVSSGSSPATSVEDRIVYDSPVNRYFKQP